MLFSVEQAFVGREEIRAPLKTPAWEATLDGMLVHNRFNLSRMPMVSNSFKGELQFLVQGNNHQSSLL